VDIAIATSHWTQTGTKKGSDRIQERFAKSETSGGIANQGSEDITVAKGDSHGGTERLLTPAEENTTLNLSHSVQARQFVIKHSRQQHVAVGFDKRSLRESGLSTLFWADRGLSHGKNLAAGGNLPQPILSALPALRTRAWRIRTLEFATEKPLLRGRFKGCAVEIVLASEWNSGKRNADERSCRNDLSR
jgi:hypothetical protein